MTYSTGSIIDNADYNIFVTGNASGTPNNSVPNVNSLWGTGDTGHLGYSQPDTLPSIAPGAEITATQWANLVNRVTTIADHQGTSITSMTPPTTGDIITAIATLDSNINAIWTNKLNAAASGASSTNVQDYTGTWTDSVVQINDVDFGNAEKFDAFFNGGGRITLTFAKTGGSASSVNASWAALCTACGTLSITGAGPAKTIAGVSYTGFQKDGGSGTPTTYYTSLGAHGFPSTFTTVFEQDDTDPTYTANNIRVRISKINSQTTLRIEVRFLDGHTGPGDGVDGTIGTTVTAIEPSTVYLADSWGPITLQGSNSSVV